MTCRVRSLAALVEISKAPAPPAKVLCHFIVNRLRDLAQSQASLTGEAGSGVISGI
jgi:hypothetical protein